MSNFFPWNLGILELFSNIVKSTIWLKNFVDAVFWVTFETFQTNFQLEIVLENWGGFAADKEHTF